MVRSLAEDFFAAARSHTVHRYGNALYRPSNELTQIVTRIQGSMDVEYRYSDTQNNGQITQQKNRGTGEEVTYQYDSLSRLIAAATTDASWGQAFTYDGFGNRTGATVTKGTAPSSSTVFDALTNRTIDSAYDANVSRTGWSRQRVRAMATLPTTSGSGRITASAARN
jgi:YD repeat-containing protein